MPVARAVPPLTLLIVVATPPRAPAAVSGILHAKVHEVGFTAAAKPENAVEVAHGVLLRMRGGEVVDGGRLGLRLGWDVVEGGQPRP